jgi:hypothetical protein
MKKRWMLVLLSAGLFQAAVADVLVTAQGADFMGEKTVDCPGTSVDCAGHVTDISLSGPLSVNFNIAFGATPGQTTFVTRTTSFTDVVTGRAFTVFSATQRYAQWVTADPADGQNPTLPDSPANPLEGDASATLSVLNSAYRNRSISVWADTGEVFRSTQSWTLQSQQTWRGDGVSGYQRRLSLTGYDSGFMATLDSYDDLESADYFVDLLTRSQDCVNCVGILMQDWHTGVDETFNSVYLAAGGQLTSITGSTAAAVVPEPSTYALILAGVAGMGVAVRRQRAAATIKP